MDANYNLSGLVSRLKVRLEDDEYPDSDLKQFINDTYFEVLGEAHYQFLERIFRQYADGSGMFILPCDYQTILNFTYKLNDNVAPFKYMPAKDFTSMDRHSGVKNYYYTVFGGQILYSLPELGDEQDDMYELTLYYLAKPKALTEDTDVPLIPAEFGEILVLGAQVRAERRRDNFDYAAIYKNDYDELVTNMKLRYCPRQLEGENRAILPVAQRLRH